MARHCATQSDRLHWEDVRQAHASALKIRERMRSMQAISTFGAFCSRAEIRRSGDTSTRLICGGVRPIWGAMRPPVMAASAAWSSSCPPAMVCLLPELRPSNEKRSLPAESSGRAWTSQQALGTIRTKASPTKVPQVAACRRLTRAPSQWCRTAAGLLSCGRELPIKYRTRPIGLLISWPITV
jgi:hypothetical protein